MSDVSIPSSSGHVFDHEETKGKRNENEDGFNPLVIGARLRPHGARWSTAHNGTVSIPSSSGHVFDQEWVGLQEPEPGSFNPLVIGARLRPGCAPERHPRQHEFQSPRHRGTSSTEEDTTMTRKELRFQSPRHRGTSSTNLPAHLVARRALRFNPLVIGARLRPAYLRTHGWHKACLPPFADPHPPGLHELVARRQIPPDLAAVAHLAEFADPVCHAISSASSGSMYTPVPNSSVAAWQRPQSR